MNERRSIAVDLGAESGRTVLCRFNGHRLSLEETHRFGNEPVQWLDQFLWDLPRLWRDIKQGIGKSAALGESIDCVGIDTWGVDFAFVDPRGVLLENAVHYRDSRTAGYPEKAFAVVPRSELYRRTGLQFLPFNSLFQLAALREQRGADAFAGRRTLLFIPDLFNLALTGEQLAEYTVASTSQFMDPWKRTWASDLLDRFEIPRSILPTLVETGTAIGGVRPALAKELGLSGATVIATASHDTASAVVAAPGEGSSWCYISSGTWSLMGAELSSPRVDERTLNDDFTNEGGVAGTIRLLKNIMGLWLVQECRRALQRRHKDMDYGVLTQEAARAPAFGPIIYPDDRRFLRPDDMLDAIQQYCVDSGQQAPESEGSLIRCCLESLALQYRRVLGRLEENVGRPLETIHIVGGGSRNELLCQLTANCCRRTVLAGPVEATAIGNALVQLMGLGDIRGLDEAREIVRESFPTRRYEPVIDARWDAHFELFTRLWRRSNGGGP